MDATNRNAKWVDGGKRIWPQMMSHIGNCEPLFKHIPYTVQAIPAMPHARSTVEIDCGTNED